MSDLHLHNDGQDFICMDCGTVLPRTRDNPFPKHQCQQFSKITDPKLVRITREAWEQIRGLIALSVRDVTPKDVGLRVVEGVVVPRELAVTVDAQGVRFGKWCWFSHERITGCVAEHIPTAPIAKTYWQWCQAMPSAAQKEQQ